MPRIVNRSADPASGDLQAVASSGHAFAALGCEQPELEVAKARRSHQIATELAARQLTQRAAAAVLGIDQPRVSLLVHGKTGQFSLEQLIACLARLSDDIRIQAVPSPDTARGRLVVSV